MFSRNSDIFSAFSKSIFCSIIVESDFFSQAFSHSIASALETINCSLSGSNKTKCSTDLINGFDMLKIFLSFFLLFALQIIYITDAYAFDNAGIRRFLEKREKNWPSWNLPHLLYSDISKDLIYPNWFEGDWIVTSQDFKDSDKEPITYKVNFFKNDEEQVIGNRSKNAEALGQVIFGERLQKIKTDPKSFNNQIIFLSDNEYIESRVTERNQILDNDLFWSDEFFIQTVHKKEASRINQVEVMSKFYKCKDYDLQIKRGLKGDICGIQYTATYGSKVGDKRIESITSSKFLLRFQPIES
mgnify:CR=1 FL=1